MNIPVAIPSLPYIIPMQGLYKGISPQNMALYGTVPPLYWDAEILIDNKTQMF